MRRFVLNLVIFFGAVVFLVALWSGLLIYCEYGRWLESCRMPEGKSVVVCCDSQTEVGLDPSFWPELFNVSRSGTRFRQYYLRQLDLCRENRGRIKLALIDVSILKYYLTQPDDARDNRGEDQLSTLELLHRSSSGLSFYTALDEFFSAVWQKQSKRVLRGVFGGKYKSLVCGGFEPLYARSAMTQRERFVEVARARANEINRAYRELSVRDENPEMLYWLQRSIDHYRAEGARVVLIQTPVHPLVRNLAADAADAANVAIRKLADRNGVGYVNLERMEIPDDQWADVNHVNRSGSQRLTRVLRDCDKIH